MTEPAKNKIKLKNLLDVVIETERLLMEPVSLEYADKIFTEFTDEITLFMFPSAAKDISETKRFIEDSREKMRSGTDIFVSVFEKTKGEFLGGGGLHHLDTKTPELGIWIKKSAHGHKFGQEAVTGLKLFADENLDYEYLFYPVAADNIASRKIPELLGGKLVREFIGEKQNGEKMKEVEYRIYPNK